MKIKPALCLLFFLYLAIPLLAYAVNSEWPEMIVPSFWVLLLWIGPIAIYSKIENELNQLTCAFWLMWFLVGTLNIIASYVKYGILYLLEVNYAGFVYVLFTASYFLFIFLGEQYISQKTRRPHGESQLEKKSLRSSVANSEVYGHGGSFLGAHAPFSIILMVFPFILFVSIYSAAGFIPLLSGSNIESDMYTANFGYLYGYIAVTILSLLLIFERLLFSQSKVQRLVLISFILFIAFVSLMTGKRMYILIFFAAMLARLVLHRGRGLSFGIFLRPLLALLVIYIGIQISRQGSDSNIQSLDGYFSILGVEYRDYVFALNNFEDSMLENYSWFTSMLASALNSTILSLFGFNKLDLINLDLGWLSKDLFLGGEFGVRTGLISELYLAYGFFGLIPISIFGLVTAYVSHATKNETNEYRRIFLCAIYGLFALVLTENSVDVSGTLTVFFYVWILYRLVPHLKSTPAAIAALKLH